MPHENMGCKVVAARTGSGWLCNIAATGYLSLLIGNCSIFLDQSTKDLLMKVAATFIEQVGEMYSEKAMTACQSLTVL